GRTIAHARVLADECGGDAIGFEQRYEAIAKSDAVIVAVSAPDCVIRANELKPFLTARESKIIIVDMGLPRNVEQACNDIEGIEVCDLDELAMKAQTNMYERRRCIAAAQIIIDAETRAYLEWLQALMVQPTIKEMYAKCNEMVDTELLRAQKELAKAKGKALSKEEQAVLDALKGSLVSKLLHGPTARLRAEAQSGDSSYLTTSARYLFGLDTHPQDVQAYHGGMKENK
ncbi:MAG: glutamyl-tRNA reductase, partial [Eggerthellaceae bacterium]|nr:glutamyl-tRNA reductase [Eggerthellaceae bacterium]